MDIGDLLAPKGVVLRGGASSKRQALHALSEAASHALGVDDGEVFTTAEIISRKQLPAEAMEFTLRPDEMTEKFMDALPGQYTSIGVRLPDGARQLRQYSLVDVDKETGCIRIAVQRDGEVSSFLMDSLSDGGRVDATLPAGDLVLEDSSAPVVLVSQGIGSTPMVGMLSALAAKGGQERKVVVLHADASAEEHSQAELQKNLSEQIGATFKTFYREDGKRMNLGELAAEGVVPADAHSSTTPTRNATSPTRVMRNAFTAAARAASRSLSCPTSR